MGYRTPKVFKSICVCEGMKLITALSIMALCCSSLCIGQAGTSVSDVKPLIMDTGTQHTFSFYDNDVHIGDCQYTVVKREVYNGVEAYFIESTVELTGPVTVVIDAAYMVDTNGRCLHYEVEGSINNEPMRINADFTENAVHITGSKGDVDYDKTIELAQNTFSADNNMIGQWDIMFSSVVLGGTFAANIFAAQPIETGYIRASIADIIVPVQAAGETWECYKLEFSSPAGYTAYVTANGQLVKMETGSGLVVILTE